MQFIDVRDVARWILHAARGNITGPINATGTPGTHTMESVLTAINTVTGGRSELAWVDEAFLLDHGVRPWEQLPLWLPTRSVPSYAGHMLRSNRRALELGLDLRPLDDTITATRADVRNPGEPGPSKDFGNTLPKPGLEPTEEAALLQDWFTLG